MHLSNDFIELVVRASALVFAYFFSVTVTGYAQARIALALGDDTPESAGFLTLNPLAHLDIIGFLLLLFFGSFFKIGATLWCRGAYLYGHCHYFTIFISNIIGRSPIAGDAIYIWHGTYPA
jgi:hypothetical protein